MWKRLGFACSLILMLCTPVFAVPYQGYLFNFWENTVPAPQSYVPETMYTGDLLGVGAFSNPQDIFVSGDILYVLDAGNNRIVLFDSTFSFLKELKGFVGENGKEDSFDSPRGIFVTRNQELYVADRNNGRLVHFGPDLEFIRVISEPSTVIQGVLPEGFRYLPRQVVVDLAGRIYVISEGTYDGILEFDHTGTFRGFIGAPRVAPSLADWFWSRIATSEQRQRRALFLPTEYSNMQIDDRGFIYASVSGVSTGEEDAIRRLNPTGLDVLRRQGFHPPIGDVRYPYTGSGASIDGRSIFVDIVPREHRMYSALDRRRGRVFTYDANGTLLYVFGARGDLLGQSQGPVALAALGENLLVVDSQSHRITVFRPTDYAKSIHQALSYHQRGYYDEATTMWEKVLTYNANFDQAYTGIGRSLLRQDRFYEAMEFFKLGNNRKDYSEALGLHRREVIADNFEVIMWVFVFFSLLMFLIAKYRPHKKFITYWNENFGWQHDARYLSAATSEAPSSFSLRARETIRSLWYAVYLITHPFDGFWDLKHEKRGNTIAATIILGLVTLTFVFSRQYTGFIINTTDLTRLNIVVEFMSLMIPFALWTGVNWSLTTLLDGKGTLADIYISSAFALTPIVLMYVPLTIISNFITIEEATFVFVLTSITLLWSLGLLFAGNMTIHEFYTTKTVVCGFLTLGGMFLVSFIGLLFFSLIGEMVSFLSSIYAEIVFRM